MNFCVDLKLNGKSSNELFRCLTLFEHFCDEYKIYNTNSEISMTSSILTQICNKLSDFIDDYEIKPDEILNFPDSIDETIQATAAFRELLGLDKEKKTTQILNELRKEFGIEGRPIEVAQYKNATVVKLPFPDQYVILKGSKISTEQYKSCPPKATNFRTELINGGLIDRTGHLQENFKVYGKASCVASIIVGYSVNGNLILQFAEYL